MQSSGTAAFAKQAPSLPRTRCLSYKKRSKRELFWVKSANELTQQAVSF